MSVLRYKIKWEKHVTEATPARRWNLSPAEQENVRRAIRTLRRQYGEAKLPALLNANPNTVKHATERRRKPSPLIAIRAARLAGVTVEDVLSGAWPAAGPCPMCGRGLVTAM